MRTKILTFLLMACLGHVAHAQWQTTTYTLKGGWNSIYLHGDASHATPDVLFAAGDALNIEEVWRWNPNPTQVQFTTDPLIPAPGTPEWSTWYRGNPGASTLSALTGQTAFLVKCAGTAGTSYTVTIKHRPQPPTTNWVRNGANLLGFPSLENGASFPTMSNYFATFPAAFAASSKIYKYVGGDLGPGNPIQVFSPTFEQLDRNQAYWFEAETTGNFYGPIEISPTNSSGLEFGRTGSIISVRLRNRTDAPVTMTMTPVASESAPSGETAIAGAVPLTRRTFNTGTNQFEETPIGGAITEVLGPQSTVEIDFGIDRGSLSANSSDHYASFLRFTDSSNLMDVLIPASAQPSSMAGLWVGDVEVDSVVSEAGSPGATTLRSFPLRYILHVDDGGTARILSQVFVGELDASGEFGNCSLESALKQDAKASATKISAAHMPLDQVLDSGTGSVALGSTLQRTITIDFDNETNPFVHQYHPDHDNKDADGDPLGAGEESYSVTRAVSFGFLASPPPGTPSTGWGTTVLGGNYTETITGAHRSALSTSGSFTFRRINEIGSITTP